MDDNHDTESKTEIVIEQNGPISCDVDELSNSTIDEKLVFYRDKVTLLLNQQSINEENFSKKRAQFMDLFKKREHELDDLKLTNKKIIENNANQENIIKDLNQEIENLKAAIILMENSQKDELEQLKSRQVEEIASVQAIMNDALNQDCRTERIEELEMENSALKEKLERKDSLLASVSKTFQKRLSPKGNNSPTKHENLEDSMIKAQENTELLRSIVLPYEEEIESLKKTINSQKIAISKFSKETVISEINNDFLCSEEESLKAENNISEISNQLKTLQNLYQISSDEYQLFQQLSSTDIQRILQFVDEEKLLLIEEAQSNDEGRKTVNKKLREIREKRAKMENDGKINIQLQQQQQQQEACLKCNTLNKEMQDIKENHQKTVSHMKTLERHLESERQASARLKVYADELEDQLKIKANNFDITIAELKQQYETVTDSLKTVRGHYKEFRERMLVDFTRVKDEREQAYLELRRFQAENECLIGKHSAHANQLIDEDINFPTEANEMQFYVLQLREELIKAKVAKEHVEEQLNSKILFIKEQLNSEQLERLRVEDALSKDIFDAKQELNKILEEKSKAEQEILNLKQKIYSLQSDLTNSEYVQRDFVKLSQSLQIELERERAKQTEVRWQAEDDVDECNRCKTSFSVTKRKHHCRHCGRIFCSDCVSNSVPSGPSRKPAKVCEVCHTMLVPDAKPFFSQDLRQQTA